MTLLRMLAFMPADSPELGSDEKKPAKSIPLQTSLLDAGEARAPVKTASENSLKKNHFDGDWADLVVHLKLAGMAKMLAQHCELANYAGNSLELRIPELHKHLLEKSYQDKLKLALNDYFGERMAVTFAIGGNGNTPAEKEHREKQERQMRAVEAIEKDPFVRELVENFDAKVIDSSIKPIQ
jgi:DNA polymerase-3 subunit gamma/tau